MPERLWKSTHTIVFSTQANSEDPKWRKEYNDPTFKSVATGGDGFVIVYNSDLSFANTSHEFGHNLATKVFGSTTPYVNSEYGQAQKKEHPVTEYGAKNKAEDFAEACKLYTTRKEYLKKNFR